MNIKNSLLILSRLDDKLVVRRDVENTAPSTRVRQLSNVTNYNIPLPDGLAVNLTRMTPIDPKGQNHIKKRFLCLAHIQMMMYMPWAEH